MTIKKHWETGDDCVSCGHGHVFFFEERTEDDGRGGKLHLGDLICANCGASQQQSCFDYQVPQVEPEQGPLFGGAK